MDHRDTPPDIEPRPAHDRRPATTKRAPDDASEGASEPAPAHVLCDAAGLGRADLGTVDALARLALGLRRLGCRFEIRHASPELRDLLALAGLDAVLRCPDASGVEAER